MCAGNCSGNCGCAPQALPGKPGRPGDPGATPDISIAVTGLAAGEDPTVVESGTLLNPLFTIGIPAGAPGAAGAAGTPAVNLYTSLTNAFTIPALNSSTVATVGNTSWMRVGSWVRMANGSSPAAYLFIAAVPTSTTVQLVNMGSVYGWPDGVALQPAPGTIIATDSAQTQVMHAAAPGLPGDDGDTGPTGPTGPAGITPEIEVVYSIPSLPPVSDANNFVFYANQTPPTPATTFVPYQWNGASWVAGPSIAGTPGTRTFFGTADPNVVAPSGSVIGDNYWRVSGGTATAYVRTGVSTWTAQGTIPGAGSITQDIDHTSGPGSVTLDLSYFSFDVQADKDIELKYDNSSFSEQGNWTVYITNVDAAPINLTYFAGAWERDPAVTLPATIGAGDTQVLHFEKNPTSGLYVFTAEFIPVAV